MLTRSIEVRQLQLCDPTVFGDVVVTCQSPPLTPEAMPFIPDGLPPKTASAKCESTGIKSVPIIRKIYKEIQVIPLEVEKRKTSALVDQLLVDIYNHANTTTDYNSGTSTKSLKNFRLDSFTEESLHEKGKVFLALFYYLGTSIF